MQQDQEDDVKASMIEISIAEEQTLAYIFVLRSTIQAQSKQHEQSIKMNTNHLPYVMTFNHHY